MNRMTIKCVRCGVEATRSTNARSRMCIPCTNAHNNESLKAGRAVAQAIRKGILKRAPAHPCTDCAKPATEYDHRDYLQPLAVEPVCRSCNHKRGTALDSVLRMQAMSLVGGQAVPG